MVSCDEATLILRKWASEGTLLLLRGKSPTYTPSMLGILESAQAEVIRFRVQVCGYIDIHLSPEIQFEYFDPAIERMTRRDGTETMEQPEEIATGAGIVAFDLAGDFFTFLEILPV